MKMSFENLNHLKMYEQIFTQLGVFDIKIHNLVIRLIKRWLSLDLYSILSKTLFEKKS